MKKKALKIILPVIASMLLSTIGFLFIKEADYRLDSTEFNTTVAYQEEVDLSGLQIVEILDEEKTYIPVDESMVTSCDSTSSVGEKSLKISYEDNEFEVNFTVKYRVQFLSNNEIIDTQYVLSASQINVPEDPSKSGFEFDGWSPSVPDVINDNMIFEAEFRDVNLPSETFGVIVEGITKPGIGRYTSGYGYFFNL
jgi:hypothetical protein